jgi:hypothetical protein
MRVPTAPWLLPALLLACALGASPGTRACADEPPAPPPEPPPCPAPAPAPPIPDVITLDNGSKFEGAIVEEDASQVVLEVTSSTGGLSKVTIQRARISTILRGDGRTGPAPAPVTQREAWFVLYSGGEPVGTRHEVLRSQRVDGQPGFRLEETIVQLPQGKRIPRGRFERVEDTDARFLPRRMHYRESIEPLGEEEGLARFERSSAGRVEADVWIATWRRGAEGGQEEVALPSETRGVLGLRELMLRSERTPGLARTVVLDVAENRLIDVEAGFASVAEATGGVDELQWVVGGQRRITRYRGMDVVEDRVSEGVRALAVSQAQARAVEQGARATAADPAQREVNLVEPGLKLRLPGADWTVVRPVTSGLDAGRRVVARLTSQILLADVRVEWDPEGTPPGATQSSLQAALLARLKDVCPDLELVESARPVPEVPGAFVVGLSGTLRDTPVRTRAWVAPRGRGLVYFLAALPEASWEAGRQALDELLRSIRPL